MQHKPPSHQTRRVGQAVGKQAAGGVQQEPRGSDAVRSDQDDVSGLPVFAVILVKPEGTGGAAVGSEGDLAYSGSRDEPCAGGDRLWPMGEIGRRLRALAATLATGTALGAAVIRG